LYPATDESNLVLFEAWKRRQKNILSERFYKELEIIVKGTTWQGNL
jgi:hypothetical protein